MTVSNNELCKTMSVLFGTEITSMHGVVVEKNVRRQVRMDGRNIYKMRVF